VVQIVVQLSTIDAVVMHLVPVGVGRNSNIVVYEANGTMDEMIGTMPLMNITQARRIYVPTTRYTR
jgi:hypothetical protein